MSEVHTGYERIMLAVDLTEESSRVAERAVALAAAYGAELHVVHVIEPLSLAYGGDIPMDLSSVQEQIHDQAKSHLAEFAATLNVPAEHQYLIFGRPESEIQRAAEAKGADVIVVGSHGRHGLALLLGSTANGVLHGANCDVLAVRVGAEDSNESQDPPDDG
jgi:universal stress protein A